MKKTERHLSSRDRRILEFIARYRIGTVELLAAHCFNSTSLENVTRVIRRLERRGLLRTVAAGSGYAYQTVTCQTLELLGLDPRAPRPLTEQTLPAKLAVASYCVHHKTELLTSQEFQDLYPELWRVGMRSSSYVLVEQEEKLRLQMLIVDRGGAIHRICARIRRLIAQRKSLPKFLSLMESQRFQIVILVGTSEQQGKIDRRIKSRPFKLVTVSTFLLPQLAELLLVRRK